VNDGGLFAASAQHQTVRFGTFTVHVTAPDRCDGTHLVLVKGSVAQAPDVVCRIASSCVTSTALDSAECDCHPQLDEAMRQIARRGRGILIYLAQEGRGLGIVNKVRALANKNRGMDTFAAVEAMGLAADIRRYDDAVQILHALAPASVALLTNNPDKIAALTNGGITVSAVLPLVVAVPRHAVRHLVAKRQRGHLFPDGSQFTSEMTTTWRDQADRCSQTTRSSRRSRRAGWR